MKNIQQLREICQLPREQYDMWFQRRFSRRVSIYISLLFMKLGIRANAATVIFMLAGVFTGAVFAIGGRGGMLAGALMLQLWYVLDHVDGEIARYNKESSLTGIYFDYLTHYIVHPVVYFGIAFGLYRTSGDVRYFLWGTAGVIGVMLFSVVGDLKDLVVFRDCIRSEPLKPVTDDEREKGESGAASHVFSKVHFAATFPVFLIVITITALLDFFIKTEITKYIYLIYVALINIVWMLRAAFFIRKRRADSDAVSVRKV